MQIVTVSPKYQVVIPKSVRRAINLRPGQKMQVVEYNGRIELIPLRDIAELRGFLKGINTKFEREDDRIRTSSILPLGWHTSQTNRMQCISCPR